MKVIVDTCVWSEVFRKKQSRDERIFRELYDLISTVRAQMTGPIRQELLSGIKYKKQFDQLKNYLNSFSDLAIEKADYEMAAEFFNTCRSNGVQGSNTDFLICAIAYRQKYEIFTLDKDFKLFSKVLPINLYEARLAEI